MDDSQKKLLYDILEAIRAIDNYVGQPKEFERYDADSMVQHAVERNLEIIGEAMSKLLNLYPQIQISNSRRIVDTRNIIIHGYDSLDSVQIWAIVINHLPVLKGEVESHLNQ